MNKKRLFVLAALVVLCVTIMLLLSNDRDRQRSRRETIAKTPEPQVTQREVAAPPITPPAEPTAFRQSFKFEEFDGQVVAGLAVRFSTPDQSIESETDQSGMVELTRKGPGKTRVETLDAAWHLTKSEFATAESLTTVIVYRELQVDGVVRVLAEDPLDLTKVKVGFSVGAARAGEEQGAPRLHRLARYGLPMSGRLANPDAEGFFEGKLPRVAGYVVHASIPGWFAESVPVPMDTEASRVSLLLELRKGTRLHGRILDDAGKPVPKGTSVHVYITIRGDPETLTVEEAMRLRGSARCGMTCGISVQRGESIVNFHYLAFTNDAGEYSLVVQHRGDVIARAHVSGHAPATARSGWLPAQGQNLDLVANRVLAPTDIEIKVEGFPQVNARVQIVDLVSRGPQMAILTKTDGKGCLPSTWLEPGHEYMIGVGEPPAHVVNRTYVKWHGQHSINIVPRGKEGFKDLPKDWW